MFEVDSLQEIICDHLIKTIKPSNSLDIYYWANIFSRHYPNLKQTAEVFICDNFMKITECEEFLNLPSEQLCRILSNDKLAVDKEETVYKAAINWFHHDPDNRRDELTNIMSYVKFPLMQQQYLATLDRGEYSSAIRGTMY